MNLSRFLCHLRIIRAICSSKTNKFPSLSPPKYYFRKICLYAAVTFFFFRFSFFPLLKLRYTNPSNPLHTWLILRFPFSIHFPICWLFAGRRGWLMSVDLADPNYPRRVSAYTPEHHSRGSGWPAECNNRSTIIVIRQWRLTRLSRVSRDSMPRGSFRPQWNGKPSKAPHYLWLIDR